MGQSWWNCESDVWARVGGIVRVVFWCRVGGIVKVVFWARVGGIVKVICGPELVEF